MPPISKFLLLCILSALALVILLAGLMFGSVDYPVAHVLRTIGGGETGAVREVIWQLRIPRVFSAFACGGLLAMAGVLLQALLRNPLAEPYILGVSGGAAVAALSAMLAGLSLIAVNSAALFGALGAIGIVLVLNVASGTWNVLRLLLTGVVLSAGFGALISLLLAIAPAAQVRGMLFWLMGDLAYASHPLLSWIMLGLLGTISIWQARNLDVLSLGELKAKSLGVAVLPVQIGVYFLAAAATATVVVEAGAIGFVGLMIPHGVRLLGVIQHRWLLPLSMLAGGCFLTLADTLARTAVAPSQLPVGVLTALMGVPLLLFLLGRKP